MHTVCLYSWEKWKKVPQKSTQKHKKTKNKNKKQIRAIPAPLYIISYFSIFYVNIRLREGWSIEKSQF